MSGGHGHDDPHGAHGHGAPSAGHDTGSHGPAEIPPAPVPRMITPARADYQQPWPGPLLLWPAVWLGVALLFFMAARTWSHPIDEGHEGGAHSPAAPHEAAPHGEGHGK